MQARDANANVFFVGLMGAGKTSVGLPLARRLQRPFFDSDHEIEARSGARIPAIFELEGEAGFREVRHVPATALTQRYFANRSDGLHPPDNGEELLVATA